jgi:hypothetical protein
VDIQRYLKFVPRLKYKKVTSAVRRVIEDEGLDEEFPDSVWTVADLPITDEEAEALMDMDDDAIDEWAEFDFKLKTKYKLRYIDIIDYDRGIVRILRRDDGQTKTLTTR